MHDLDFTNTIVLFHLTDRLIRCQGFRFGKKKKEKFWFSFQIMHAKKVS